MTKVEFIVGRKDSQKKLMKDLQFLVKDQNKITKVVNVLDGRLDSQKKLMYELQTLLKNKKINLNQVNSFLGIKDTP